MRAQGRRWGHDGNRGREVPGTQVCAVMQGESEGGSKLFLTWSAKPRNALQYQQSSGVFSFLVPAHKCRQ